MSKSLLAWHWLDANGRTANGEGIQVVPGQRLSMRGPIKLCSRGYHASERAIDALQYAPGPIVCRVKLSGTICKDTDKAVATVRTCLWMADASRTLNEFACWCVEQAFEEIRKIGIEPDQRSIQAVNVIRLWLDGKATIRELDAASYAARDAAMQPAMQLCSPLCQRCSPRCSQREAKRST